MFLTAHLLRPSCYSKPAWKNLKTRLHSCLVGNQCQSTCGRRWASAGWSHATTCTGLLNARWMQLNAALTQSHIPQLAGHYPEQMYISSMTIVRCLRSESLGRYLLAAIAWAEDIWIVQISQLKSFSQII